MVEIKNSTWKASVFSRGGHRPQLIVHQHPFESQLFGMPQAVNKDFPDLVEKEWETANDAASAALKEISKVFLNTEIHVRVVPDIGQYAETLAKHKKIPY